MKRPKAPKPTAQELAGVARQSRMIDEEKEEIEKRLKAAARGKLGSKSLLAKAGGSTSGSSPTRRGGGYGAGGTRGNAGVNSLDFLVALVLVVLILVLKLACRFAEVKHEITQRVRLVTRFKNKRTESISEDGFMARSS